jgi:hypothetical protein
LILTFAKWPLRRDANVRIGPLAQALDFTKGIGRLPAAL